MLAPEFSVSMCVYAGDNAEAFDQALNSVIDQTVKPTEIVLTIDGPIPDTIASVIEKYKIKLEGTDVAFKIIQFEKNMGHGEARRKSIDNCSCSLVAIMDADDISARDRFEKEVAAFIADPDLSIVGSHVSEFLNDDPENITAKRLVKLSDEEIKQDMSVRCPMNQPTVMFKKDDVIEVGGYIDWFCNEDYYLWIRLALANKKFLNIDDCLVNMRVDEGSYQRRGGFKYYSSEARIQKLLLNNGLIGRPRYFVNNAKRFIVQVMMPNAVRGWVFKRFARKSINKDNMNKNEWKICNVFKSRKSYLQALPRSNGHTYNSR